MTTNEIEQIADKATRYGKKLTLGLSVPMFLFVLGLFTMPFGIFFWVLAIIISISVFTPYGNTTNTADQDS